MNEKHPNRKKDKHNPYTLMIVEGRYKVVIGTDFTNDLPILNTSFFLAVT